MLHKIRGFILLGCILSLPIVSNGLATPSAEKSCSQDCTVVKSTRFPIKDISILGGTCFQEADYVKVKQEKDSLCFYFDYDKAREDGIFYLKVSAGITIVSLAVMLAGCAGIYTSKTQLCIIPAFVGAIGTICGGASTLFWVLLNSEQESEDKPFRIINKSGIWDKYSGEIKWTDINKIEVHHQEGAIMDCMIITLLQKDKDGEAEKYFLYGTLSGLVVLSKFLLNCKKVFGKKLDNTDN